MLIQFHLGFFIDLVNNYNRLGLGQEHFLNENVYTTVILTPLNLAGPLTSHISVVKNDGVLLSTPESAIFHLSFVL
jgi:hypothetical protein